VRRKWEDHLSGKGDWGRPLWNVLMFQGWLDAQRTPMASVNPTVLAPNRSRSAMPDGAELIQTT
jgi:asparagine synthase (glutamine-hydrolysing)